MTLLARGTALIDSVYRVGASFVLDASDREDDELVHLATWHSQLVGRERKHAQPYFHRHPQLSESMRSVLACWMMEVCAEYELQRETYYMAVDYVDRFLSGTDDLAPKLLQLVGVTALFIASKMEEVQRPTMQDFALVTGGAFDQDSIRRMERIMLGLLDWQLNPVTAVHFVGLYLHRFHDEMVRQGRVQATSPAARDAGVCSSLDRSSYLAACHLLDKLSVDARLMHSFPPSVLAAGVLAPHVVHMATLLGVPQPHPLCAALFACRRADLHDFTVLMSGCGLLEEMEAALPAAHVAPFDVTATDADRWQTYDAALLPAALERAGQLRRTPSHSD